MLTERYASSEHDMGFEMPGRACGGNKNGAVPYEVGGARLACQGMARDTARVLADMG